MKITKYIPFYLTLLLVMVFTFNVDAQCAMCAATAEKSEYAKSLNQGILYLLGAPVVLVAGVIILWIKNKDDFK